MVASLVICFNGFIWFTFAHEYLVFWFILDLLVVELSNGLLNVLNKGLDPVCNKKDFNVLKKYIYFTYVFHINYHLSLVTCTHAAVVPRYHERGVTLQLTQNSQDGFKITSYLLLHR